MKSSPLLSILLIVLVDVLGLTIILPLLPFYAESLGATPSTVGLLVSAYAICQLLAGPPLGQLSDRVGRKNCGAMSPQKEKTEFEQALVRYHRQRPFLAA